MLREPRTWKIALLLAAAIAAVLWNPFLHKQETVAPLFEISPDPTLLYVELLDDEGNAEIVWMLRPITQPSTSFETENAGRITRYTGAIVDATATSYRVNFQRIVTKSGETPTHGSKSSNSPSGN